MTDIEVMLEKIIEQNTQAQDSLEELKELNNELVEKIHDLVCDVQRLQGFYDTRSDDY